MCSSDLQVQERKIEKGNLNLLGYWDFDNVVAIEDDAVVIDAVAKIEGAVNGKRLAATGRSGNDSDHAIDFGESPAGKWVRIDWTDGDGKSWLKPASDFNQLSVSLWQKLHSRRASSTFWLGAASASSGERNAQAHIPWSNGQIYWDRSEEHTSELQSRRNLVCRLLLEKKKQLYRRHHASDVQYTTRRTL